VCLDTMEAKANVLNGARFELRMDISLELRSTGSWDLMEKSKLNVRGLIHPKCSV